ncbi:epoxide hydrolase family protein [Nocardiopsis trehalosi]|uniref:epoxide hydrolase family protein n=1 Tax=Nocardiopsis trehalosi TaxID=109329 RepID=UPI00082971BA|nr:epoxide hydrolase family protein [Nocardiopsis trehalosi]
MKNSSEIRPFRAEVPQADLDDLLHRVRNTRYTGELPGAGDAYGVTADYVRDLAAYWVDGYDWRALEDRLNTHPQFTTEIDGQNIHFLHVRSPEPDATPLLLSHGWPMSVVEYLDVIGPLTDPRSHGGDPADAFHLVIPSTPGVGFSGPTTEKGWNRYRTARAYNKLMNRLGYERYGAHGNDGGAFIAPEMGRAAPENVTGVHVTQVFSFPSGDPDELARLDEADLARVAFMQEFMAKNAFNHLQSTAPQTLAHALADSPVGQLAWSGQLFGTAVSRDYILDNVTLYWLTRTSASSMRFYYEDAHAEHPTEPTTVPLGLANFAYDFQSVRPLADRDHENIVSWNVYDTGSHYAAHDAPDLLVADIRAFFRAL